MIMLHDLCVTVCVCSEGSALFHITLLGAIKRYGLQHENRHFQCLDTLLTLARVDAHA